jgi:putative SOS response-associated peptidase YedK
LTPTNGHPLGQRPYIGVMCGRVIQARGPLHYAIVDGLDVRDSRLSNYPRRLNCCPSQEMLVIRQNYKTGERIARPVEVGGRPLFPYWCSDPKGGPQTYQRQIGDSRHASHLP